MKFDIRFISGLTQSFHDKDITPEALRHLMRQDVVELQTETTRVLIRTSMIEAITFRKSK